MKHVCTTAYLLFLSGVKGFTHLPLYSNPIAASFRGKNQRILHVKKLNAWSPFDKASQTTDTTPPEKKVEQGTFSKKNTIAAGVWVSLVTWAFFLAPGTLGADSDNELINLLITQPVPRPIQVNEIWFAIWNSFTIVPAVIAALTAPTGRNQRLPAAPFLWGSAFLGYFALGPYFVTRTESSDMALRREDLGWASRNIFENRLFGIALLVIALSIPVSSDLLVPGFDWETKVVEFGTLITQSRFVAVATVDIIIMSILSSILVAEDCRARGLEDRRILISLGTLILPVIGPSLYLAARPKLRE